MAVSFFPATHSRVHRLAHEGRVPASVLALALVAPALDLLALLQQAPALSVVAAVMASLATFALALSLLFRAPTAWLGAAMLAFGASVALRAAGLEQAPALSLLGVVALGCGGAFRASVAPTELAAFDAPRLDAPAPPAADLPPGRSHPPALERRPFRPTG